MTNRTLLAALTASVLSGCGAESSIEWLEGASYRWDLFNHRVSHIHYAATADGPMTAIVGGTSTTGLSTDLGDTCDPDTCSEFPFYDDALVGMDFVRVTSKKVQMGSGSTELVTDAAGSQAEIQVELSGRAKGDVVAVIRGYTLDTNEPLSGGDACYQPRNGWLPRRLSLSLGEPQLSDDGRSATVAVQAAFEAGVTFEDERQCLDAVVAEAQVRMWVDVAVLAGAEVDREEVSYSMSYAYGDGPSDPAEQPDPSPADRQVDLGAPDAVGWSALEFKFHQEQGETRGAYVRSLAWVADVDGLASGHATNYSPVTQLSGFDYSFQGTVVGLGLKGEVDREHAEDLVEIELDEQGVPVAQSL